MVIRGHLIQGILDSYESPHANKMLGNAGIPHLGCCVKLHLPLQSCLKENAGIQLCGSIFCFDLY
jgi:hypothetical protein